MTHPLAWKGPFDVLPPTEDERMEAESAALYLTRKAEEYLKASVDALMQRTLTEGETA